MVVIAARPGMGKTSLMMNIVEHVSLNCGIPVGVFSLEMSREQLCDRLLCCNARVSSRNARDGVLIQREQPSLVAASARLSSAKLTVNDTCGISIMQLRAQARRMKQGAAIGLLCIDYLQLLHSTNKTSKNRQEEISDISKGIKQTARELGIPVIVLAQLNRDIEKDKGRKPRLSDLRESGSIEQDADIVAMLYEPAQDDEDTYRPRTEIMQVNLLIAKHRNGPTADIPLIFNKAITRFESQANQSSPHVQDESDL
jgi:replicative DNA helicase